MSESMLRLCVVALILPRVGYSPPPSTLRPTPRLANVSGSFRSPWDNRFGSISAHLVWSRATSPAVSMWTIWRYVTEGTKVLLYVVNTAALIIPGNLYHLVISCTSSLFRIKTGTSGLGFSFSGIRLQLPAEVS
uniref:Secreted protein n=1 Tax=Cacopsylla melanoneura TaxID=428564 RepID=A0A8D8U6G5_9HEMI